MVLSLAARLASGHALRRLTGPLAVSTAALLVPPSSALAQPFLPHVEYPVGDGPNAGVLGDLNGDGDLDLVTANIGADNVSVRLGTGDGTFGAETTFPVGDAPIQVAVGDLNNDGNSDLAVTNLLDDNVSVLLGLGDGTFGVQSTYIVAGVQPRAIAIGELNGDALPDLVVTDLFAVGLNDNVSVLPGVGGGAFGAPTGFLVGDLPEDVALGDLNGDGLLDLVTANAFSDNISVLLNGGGTFGPQTTYTVGNGVPGNGARPVGVALGDFNGDGRLDVATADGNGDGVTVLLNLAGTGFLSPSSYPVGDVPSGVAVGDVNGDGVLDLVVSNEFDDTVSLLLGLGNGAFGPQTSYAVADGPNSIALGDLDGDGRLDLVTANTNSDNASVLLNAGQDAPLPVELTSFTGAATARGVSLQWATATERDNAGFTVLRDGIEIGSYRVLAGLRGHGTTGQPHGYRFTDARVRAGERYTYTLRSVDGTGAVHTYSQTVKLTAGATGAPRGPGAPTAFRLSAASPNPFNPTTTLHLSLPEAATVTATLYDAFGQLVRVMPSGSLAAGVSPLTVRADGLATGTYLVRVTAVGATGTSSSSQRVTLVK